MVLPKVYIVASAFKLKPPKKFRSLIQKLTLQHCPLHSPIHLREKHVHSCVCLSASMNY